MSLTRIAQSTNTGLVTTSATVDRIRLTARVAAYERRRGSIAGDASAWSILRTSVSGDLDASLDPDGVAEARCHD